MCLICMKYRIIIIIIISLGEILLSYIANTSRKHAHAHTGVRARSHVAVQVRSVSGAELTPFSPVPLAFMAGSWVIQINTRAHDPFLRGFGCFSRIKKLLGRTETRTRDRRYCQSIRTV